MGLQASDFCSVAVSINLTDVAQLAMTVLCKIFTCQKPHKFLFSPSKALSHSKTVFFKLL